jgi:Cu/Ag efflux protein CusF
MTVAVEDPTVLDRVKKGDKVEVTYTEAVAVAVDKP